MKLLLDTHVLYWWLAEQGRLSSTALAAISSVDGEAYVSLASAWEMAIKVGSGKWPAAERYLNDFERHAEIEHFRILSIGLPHVRAAGLMARPTAIRSKGCLPRRR